MSLSVQEVINEVKQIRGALVGISRVNKPLYQMLLQKCNKLERQLVSCCDKLTVEPVDVVGTVTVEAALAMLEDDTMSKAEIIEAIKEWHGESFEEAQGEGEEGETGEKEEEVSGIGTTGTTDSSAKGTGLDLDALLAEDEAEDGT